MVFIIGYRDIDCFLGFIFFKLLSDYLFSVLLYFYFLKVWLSTLRKYFFFFFSFLLFFSSFSTSHRSLTYERVCAQYDEGGFFYDTRANGTTVPSLTKINQLQTKWEDYNQQHRGQSSMYTDSQMQVHSKKK